MTVSDIEKQVGQNFYPWEKVINEAISTTALTLWWRHDRTRRNPKENMEDMLLWEDRDDLTFRNFPEDIPQESNGFNGRQDSTQSTLISVFDLQCYSIPHILHSIIEDPVLAIRIQNSKLIWIFSWNLSKSQFKQEKKWIALENHNVC